MFSTATKNFVEEVDHGGLLIPVSSPNDSIAILTVVVKRKRFWLWQKPKHVPTDFTLNDILSGDPPIQPVVAEMDFIIKYDGTFGDNIQGTVDASFANSSVKFEGNDTSKFKSSFGSLKKEEVDVQKLLKDSKNRVLDMSHSLIHQIMQKSKRVMGIVKERIVTTQPCSVIEEVQQGGQCGGGLSTCGPKNPKFSLQENGKVSQDSSVAMEIPGHTTLAYALIELEVKHDGRYELCLMSDTKGGFEVDGLHERLLGVTGAPAEANPSSCLKQDLDHLNDHFKLLSALPASTKTCLLQQLTKIMEDQMALIALQNTLEKMRQGKSATLDNAARTESQRQNIQAILDLLEECEDARSPQTEQSTSILGALHLLASALDEMTNDGLTALRVCCSHSLLHILQPLVECVAGSGELALSSSGLAALDEHMFTKTKHLFASSKVSLKKDGDTVKTEINQQAGSLPLVMCIAVRGLSSLGHSV